MTKITNITAGVIRDSRNEKTVKATIETDDDKMFSASVPQGKSRGSFEATCIDPDVAVHNINEKIKPILTGIDPSDQEIIDAKLIELDGTEDKSLLGANALLAVSLACARAGAGAKGIFLWRHIRGLAGAFAREKKPRLLFNLINGGLHADNDLEFQEYIIIPRTDTIKESLDIGDKIYSALKRRFPDAKLGNEGGIAPNFKNSEEPFETLLNVAEEEEMNDKIDLGLDAAASNVKKTPEELARLYKTFFDRFNLFYLEDPFPENDFEHFANLTREFGNEVAIVGDDLTVTNISRMKVAHSRESVNGVIIKPNQIGTLSETLHAVEMAREYNWSVFVSHRSGETDDDFIADLAYGIGADGIKAGAPGPPERLMKYHRLIEIEEKED